MKNKSLASLAILAALFGGCMSTLPSPKSAGMDPSNPSAPEASTPRFRQTLAATTQVYLDPSSGQGAQTMDHSKMEGMDNSQTKGMEEMDHSKMPGMEGKQPTAGASPVKPDGMQGMDHSKMPGMGAQPSATASSPASNEAVEMEMKKTSSEMKRLSDELKAKSDAAKAAEKPGDKPQPNAKSPAVMYTCPMHSQINEAKPGQCPICGMTLIKKKGQ